MSSRRGFTIIEALVSVAVFSIGILALFGAYTLAIKVMKYAKEVSVATAVATEKVEELRNTPFGNLTVITTPSPVTTSKLPQGQVKTYIDLYQGNDRIKEVSVKVYWQSRPESNAVTLTTLISQGGISD